MPWGDWQFWLVTMVALGGVWLLARSVVPKRSGRRGTRTALTVSALRRD